MTGDNRSYGWGDSFYVLELGDVGSNGLVVNREEILALKGDQDGTAIFTDYGHQIHTKLPIKEVMRRLCLSPQRVPDE